MTPTYRLLSYGFMCNWQSPTLTKNELNVEYIIMVTHIPNVLRFWWKCSVKYPRTFIPLLTLMLPCTIHIYQICSYLNSYNLNYIISKQFFLNMLN